jgi:hypothetical protein
MCDSLKAQDAKHLLLCLLLSSFFGEVPIELFSHLLSFFFVCFHC